MSEVAVPAAKSGAVDTRFRPSRVGVVLLVLIALLLPCAVIVGLGIVIDHDAERDLLRGAMLAKTGVMPVVGPEMSFLKLSLGPWYYFLLGGVFRLHPSTTVVPVLAALLWWVSAGVFIGTVRRLFGGSVALAGGVLFTFAVLNWQNFTDVSHLNLVPLLTTLVLLSAHEFFVLGRSAAFVALCFTLGLSTHFHVTSAALAIPVLVLARCFRTEARVSHLLAGATAFVLPFLPDIVVPRDSGLLGYVVTNNMLAPVLLGVVLAGRPRLWKSRSAALLAIALAAGQSVAATSVRHGVHLRFFNVDVELSALRLENFQMDAVSWRELAASLVRFGVVEQPGLLAMLVFAGLILAFLWSVFGTRDAAWMVAVFLLGTNAVAVLSAWPSRSHHYFHGAQMFNLIALVLGAERVVAWGRRHVASLQWWRSRAARVVAVAVGVVLLIATSVVGWVVTWALYQQWPWSERSRRIAGQMLMASVVGYALLISAVLFVIRQPGELGDAQRHVAFLREELGLTSDDMLTRVHGARPSGRPLLGSVGDAGFVELYLSSSLEEPSRAPGAEVLHYRWAARQSPEASGLGRLRAEWRPEVIAYSPLVAPIAQCLTREGAHPMRLPLRAELQADLSQALTPIGAPFHNPRRLTGCGVESGSEELVLEMLRLPSAGTGLDAVEVLFEESSPSSSCEASLAVDTVRVLDVEAADQRHVHSRRFLVPWHAEAVTLRLTLRRCDLRSLDVFDTQRGPVAERTPVGTL